MKLGSIQDVADYQLCCGCGICAFIAPDDIKIVNDYDQGLRPIVLNNDGLNLNNAFKACPGKGFSNEISYEHSSVDSNLIKDWGPILQIQEGFALSDSLRFKGSSGGVVSALALYGIEKHNIYGVLHTTVDDTLPFLNKTILSTTKEEIENAAGSRYSPASPCDSLQKIIDAPGKCIFIGKPCDIAAVYSETKNNPELKKKIALTISLFCAGTPTTNATLKLLNKVGVKQKNTVKKIRYRGNGWPGMTTVEYISSSTDNKKITKSKTYSETWGELTKDKQWRCNLCPDHTGEFADISIGDPWYQEISENEPGRSMLLIRTNRGLSFVEDSKGCDYIYTKKISNDYLIASQPNLLNTRGAVWGRIAALKLFGIPTPDFNGFSLFYIWFHKLTISNKLQSFYGTFKRAIIRKLWRRRTIKYQ